MRLPKRLWQIKPSKDKIGMAAPEEWKGYPASVKMVPLCPNCNDEIVLDCLDGEELEADAGQCMNCTAAIVFDKPLKDLKAGDPIRFFF